MTGETTQVKEEQGQPRFVTAGDFVASIRRLCETTIGGYYGSFIAPLILGCAEVLNNYAGGTAPQSLIEAIGVDAPDEQTLVIQLAYPAGFFVSMTSMWVLSATPQWTIEKYGEKWIEAGTIVTNGRYVLSEWLHNIPVTVQRNPFMPADMAGEGNIERRIEQSVSDEVTAYSLWLNQQLDSATIPAEGLETHLDTFPEETWQWPIMRCFTLGSPRPNRRLMMCECVRPLVPLSTARHLWPKCVRGRGYPCAILRRPACLVPQLH